MDEKRIVEPYVLTPEDLAQRTATMKSFLAMIFDAQEKGDTDLNANLGRVDFLETGRTKVDITRGQLLVLYNIALQLGIKKDETPNLSENKPWKDLCACPAEDLAVPNAPHNA